MSFWKFVVAMMAAGGALAGPADAAVYDFTFLTNDNILGISNGTFTTDASNNIVSASGTLTSTNVSILGGASSLTFTLAGLGAGTAGFQVWDNVYNPVSQIFTGNGLGIRLANGNYSSIYDVSGFSACPGQTCISIDPTNNGPFWNPGDAGTLSVRALNNVAGGVPEPATWAMMLIGFGGVGATLRSTRKQTATI
jgi:hypothetical protein